MRAIWTGEIAFGLVTIPVRLYTATRDLTPHFTTLHRECGGRVHMARRCSTCDRDVDFGELGKGYEVGKGVYALFTKEELAKLEDDDAGGTIEIVAFVEPGAIDLSYIDKSYWVGVGGKNSRGFALLQHVLTETHRVALAKTKLRSRTRLAVVRPHGKLFALEMMRYADEIVNPDAIDVPEPRPASPRELELAHGLVQALSGPFDPARHPDQYRAAVAAAVEDKTASCELTQQPVTADRALGKVIDLAELLARSLAKTEPNGDRNRVVVQAEPATGAPRRAPAERRGGARQSGPRESKKRATG
jgi:DNA end-binding protein Ku